MTVTSANAVAKSTLRVDALGQLLAVHVTPANEQEPTQAALDEGIELQVVKLEHQRSVTVNADCVSEKRDCTTIEEAVAVRGDRKPWSPRTARRYAAASLSTSGSH